MLSLFSCKPRKINPTKGPWRVVEAIGIGRARMKCSKKEKEKVLRD
jgi:hypothetical protein